MKDLLDPKVKWDLMSLKDKKQRNLKFERSPQLRTANQLKQCSITSTKMDQRLSPKMN